MPHEGKDWKNIVVDDRIEGAEEQSSRQEPQNRKSWIFFPRETLPILKIIAHTANFSG